MLLGDILRVKNLLQGNGGAPYGTLGRADSPWKVVDDALRTANATTSAQIADTINTVFAGAVTGDKIIMPSETYNIDKPLLIPNKDAMTLTSGGESIIRQNTANTPCFQMNCDATAGNFLIEGFRFRWATNALSTDTYSAGITFKATNSASYGNGEYNFIIRRVVFENGFRGIAPHWDDIQAGHDFPLWGMDVRNIYGYQDMKGALLVLGNWGSGGGPRYTIDDLYDNATNPVEASILMDKTAGCKFGNLEFNNTNNQARILGISARGVVIDNVRFENMTLTTQNLALIIFSSPDSGRALINQLEFMSTHIGISAAANAGNVYGVEVSGGAEVEVRNLIVNNTDGNVDKFIHFHPRVDSLTGPGHPLPQGKVFHTGGLYLSPGLSGTAKQGRCYDNSTDGNSIYFDEERPYKFGQSSITADNTYHDMAVDSAGFTNYLVDRDSWVRRISIEIAGGPVTGGNVAFVIKKNGTAIGFTTLVYGQSGNSTDTKTTINFSRGRFDASVYGGSSSDNVDDLLFLNGDTLSIGLQASSVTVPDVTTLRARVTIIMARQ